MPIIRSSRVFYKWLLPVVFDTVKMEIVICRLAAVVFSALSVVRTHFISTVILIWPADIAF